MHAARPTPPRDARIARRTHSCACGKAELVNVNSGVYEQTERAYRKFTKDNFDPGKAHINAALKRHLGERLAAPYLIGRLDRIPGTRYRRFGLSLPAETA